MEYGEVQQRWAEIDCELAELVDGKVVRETDPAAREGELLEELDALEYEAGLIYSEGRGSA